MGFSMWGDRPMMMVDPRGRKGVPPRVYKGGTSANTDLDLDAASSEGSSVRWQGFDPSAAGGMTLRKFWQDTYEKELAKRNAEADEFRSTLLSRRQLR